MTRPATPAHRAVLALVCSLGLGLAAGLAAAQGAPAAPGAFAPDALVGEWTIRFPNEGGPPMIGTVAYRPDGLYEETLVIQGETVGWWRGRYALAPDGTLTLDETETSPQLCFAGQCQPNDPPTRTVAQVVEIGPSAYSATFVDESGVPATLTFERAAAGAGPLPGGPAGPSGAAVPVTPVPATPMAPGPASPDPAAPESVDPAAANPLAPAGPDEDPWAGAWSDGEVTVRIGGEAGAVLEVGGAAYPLNVSGDDTRLEGTFESEGRSYEVVLERTPGGMTVTSGGSTYRLRPAGDAPAAPGSGNPLGD